ncbi:hypothetical protein L083_4417 [Actinoplanes sp. N902-109]|nr:hypothetical protein L083_4417 [Actinoplanes sp. N902-109]
MPEIVAPPAKRISPAATGGHRDRGAREASGRAAATTVRR